MWPFKRCVHDWQVVDRTVLPSLVDQLQLQEGGATEIKGCSSSMGSRTLSLVLKCSKCGAINKTVVRSGV